MNNTDRQLPTVYDPADVEKKWYAFWTEQNYFHAQVREGKPHYCITIPPPNVTGSLHIGHALCYTIQDVLIRWKRMQGYETPVSYTHLRAHETRHDLVCRLLLE